MGPPADEKLRQAAEKGDVAGARAAPLVDESRLLAQLEAGKVALGWNDARLYRGEDGKFVRDGLSSAQEVPRREWLEILRKKRYAWVEKRVERRVKKAVVKSGPSR